MTKCSYPYPALAATVDLPGLGISGTTAGRFTPFAQVPVQKGPTPFHPTPFGPATPWCFLGDGFGDGWAYFGIAVYVTNVRSGAPANAAFYVMSMRVKGTTIEFSTPTLVRTTTTNYFVRPATDLCLRLLPCKPKGDTTLCVFWAALQPGTGANRNQAWIVKFHSGASYAAPSVVTNAKDQFYVYPHTDELTLLAPFLVVTTTPSGPVLIKGVPGYDFVTHRIYRFDTSGWILRTTPSYPTTPTHARRFTFGSFTTATATFTGNTRYHQVVTSNYVVRTFGGAPFRYIQVLHVTASGISVGTKVTLDALWVTTPTLGPTPGFGSLGLVQRVTQPGILDVVGARLAYTQVNYWRLTVITGTLTVTATPRRILKTTCYTGEPGFPFLTTATNYILMENQTPQGLDLATVTPGKIGPTRALPVRTATLLHTGAFAVGSSFFFAYRDLTTDTTKVAVYVPSSTRRDCCPGTKPPGWAVGSVHQGIDGWAVGVAG